MQKYQAITPKSKSNPINNSYPLKEEGKSYSVN